MSVKMLDTLRVSIYTIRAPAEHTGGGAEALRVSAGEVPNAHDDEDDGGEPNAHVDCSCV